MVPVLVVEQWQRTAYVGQTAVLPCHPTVKKDVDWKYQATKDGFEDYVYSNGVMYERFRDRFSVLKSNDHDYDLIVSNVSWSDAGQYICIEDMGLGARHIYDLIVTGKIALL